MGRSPDFLQELQDTQAEVNTGITIDEKKLCSKEKMNLQHISFKDVSLDRMCLKVELLISIQKFEHYALV